MRREMETPAEKKPRRETVVQEKFETPEEAEKQGELGTSEETGISEIQEKSEEGQMEAGIEEK